MIAGLVTRSRLLQVVHWTAYGLNVKPNTLLKKDDEKQLRGAVGFCPNNYDARFYSPIQPENTCIGCKSTNKHRFGEQTCHDARVLHPRRWFKQNAKAVGATFAVVFLLTRNLRLLELIGEVVYPNKSAKSPAIRFNTSSSSLSESESLLISKAC